MLESHSVLKAAIQIPESAAIPCESDRVIIENLFCRVFDIAQIIF